ncbi:Protein kinase alk2 [Thecaphora frezii]|nr:putative p450 oxidoreductase [Thecaphora frezii]
MLSISALSPRFGSDWVQFLPSLDQAPFLYAALILVALIVVLALIAPDRYIFSSHRAGISEMPGAWPILGNMRFLLDAKAKRATILTLAENLQKTAGKGGRPLGATFPALGGRVTIINRPEYIRWVQKTNFENYIKGPDFAKSMGDVMSTHGIFVADGEVWKKQRKMASHIFSVSNFRTHVQATIQRDLKMLRSVAKDAARKQAEVDLPDLFFRFTLSSFSLMAFSADVGCLPTEVHKLQEAVAFAKNFDYAQRIMDERFFDPFPTWIELFTAQGRKMRQTIRELHSFCYRIIDLRMEANSRGEGQAASGKGGKDLLALFMEQNLKREDLLPIVLNFLIAGRDTTAQTLSWLFYEFYKKPECMEKCRQEVHEKLGSGDTYRPMSYDDLGSLVYTQACLYEALRLHPSVPKNMKKAVRDDVIRPYAQQLDGGEKVPTAVKSDKLPDLVIKAGETVIWMDYVMARMPELWGPDCEEFKPERFLEQRDDGTASIKTYSQYLFHAFNAGPRLCLGQTLATYEGCAVTAEILAHFNIIFDKEAMERDPPRFDDSLTLPIKNPYCVRFETRSD